MVMIMTPMKLGEGLTSKIIFSGEPLLINKDVQELRAQLGVQRMGVPAASYLGVPIPVGDEIIGVLSVQSTEQENVLMKMIYVFYQPLLLQLELL